jgi:hypothetical protein
MKNLGLTNSNKLAFVDDEDFLVCKKFNWCLCDKTILTTQLMSMKNIPLASFIMGNFKQMYDHKDRNSFNNQKVNLRSCTYSQNNANRSKMEGTSSKYRGVSFYKPSQKWRTQIEYNDKGLHLGYFVFEAEAARAYDKKAKELFGEFANLNFKEVKL